MDVQSKSEEEQLALFEAFLDCFERARAEGGEEAHWFRVAGSTVKISFAGPTMAPRTVPALEHLRTEPATAPDFTLCLWDTAGTGVPAPPPPCQRADLTDRGDIWGFNSGRIKTAFHWSDYSVNLFDHDRDLGLFWVENGADLPYWAEASPLRTLFHWWFERHGGQLVHGAAVGTPDGAVLITGKGGVGKSTSALASLEAGLRYLGDDYVIVRGGPNPSVCSLYCTAKLDADHVGRFPRLADAIANPEKLHEEKAVLSLVPRFREQIARELPLQAILTPRIADREETTISPGSPLVLRQAACFTTMSQLPNVGRHTHEFFDALCSSVPGHVLELGRDLPGIPAAISGLLADRGPRTVAGRDSGPPAATTPAESLVSVVVPVFNGERFIGEALENIVSQDYPALEIIVVDDGSTDGTEAAVREFPFDIRYFRQENNGPASARNRGIRDTSGDLLAFLDADDLWPADNLRMLVGEMSRHPELDVVHGHAQLLIHDPATGRFEFRGNPTEAFAHYIGAGLYRKRAFGAVGLFDEQLRFGEDTDWFNRAREMARPVRRLDAITLHVRRHGENMTCGRSLVELNLLRVFKKARDRQTRLREEERSR